MFASPVVADYPSARPDNLTKLHSRVARVWLQAFGLFRRGRGMTLSGIEKLRQVFLKPDLAKRIWWSFVASAIADQPRQ
jgi:hypothetical protein